MIDDFISVSGFESEQIPLRKEGEERFKYSPTFWNWFKEKIEYTDEELSFIIITDRELVIPNEIQIAKKSSFKEIPIVQKYKNTKLYTYPEIEKKAQLILKKAKDKQFADYFVSKTKKYSK